MRSDHIPARESNSQTVILLNIDVETSPMTKEQTHVKLFDYVLQIPVGS